MMRGMVLAAGRGERMRPLTYRLAKPAIPVLNRPLLSYGLRLLRQAGVRHAAVNAHHLPESVDEVLRAWTPKGMEVTLFRPVMERVQREEPRHRVHIGRMQLGDVEIVVDDQHPEILRHRCPFRWAPSRWALSHWAPFHRALSRWAAPSFPAGSP